MKVTIENAGKRFNRDWILKNIHFSAEEGHCVAITGSNGSGKSTLLQMIAGFVSLSEGSITWKHGETTLQVEHIYKYFSWAGPYVSLYDEFTLKENVELFLQFKKLRGGLDVNLFAEASKLDNQKHKLLKHYSSGMKQRIKLGLAILADTPLLLLDEPASHLDSENIRWFQQLLSNNNHGRCIFIASNQQQDETFLCTHHLDVEAWKKH